MLGEAPWPCGLLLETGRLTYTSPEADEHGTPIVSVFGHGDAFHRLRYWDGSEFLVDRPGTHVWARWPAAIPAGEIEMCLLGPIIGFVLHLRGTPCLHGSAVAVDGRAVAFLGHSGAGKSTTAAAFVRAGLPALTDDVLALDEEQESGVGSREPGVESRDPAVGGESGVASPEPRFGNREPGAGPRSGETSFCVRPGHHLVRLWPDAVRALYGSEGALPRAADEKHHLDLGAAADRFQAVPLPLGAIYVLEARSPDQGRAAAITPLKGHAALMALVARTYMNYVLDAGLRARALDVFSRLAARVPVRQLTARDDANALGELREAILEDLRR
jgi:hypothetical protein